MYICPPKILQRWRENRDRPSQGCRVCRPNFIGWNAVQIQSAFAQIGRSAYSVLISARNSFAFASSVSSSVFFCKNQIVVMNLRIVAQWWILSESLLLRLYFSVFQPSFFYRVLIVEAFSTAAPMSSLYRSRWACTWNFTTRSILGCWLQSWNDIFPTWFSIWGIFWPRIAWTWA